MKKTLEGLILETSYDHEENLADSGTMEQAASPGKAGETISKENLKETPVSDGGWSPAVESEEAAAIQPLDYSERLANAVRTREELTMPHLTERDGLATADGDGIPTVESSAPRKDEDDNMWVKVGGGIAVLGAVVGGAFLAMNQDNPNSSSGNTRENQSNRSSVSIERLDDDDEGESKWEPATGEKSQ